MTEQKSFLVYRSSAGAGKTFTLVKEYLKICLENTSPGYYRHILAITFTNKASKEMKDRIISALQSLAKMEGEGDLLNVLLAETGLDKNTIQARSKAIFKHILHHYSEFAISTIDKFVQKLVRAFAFDLDLPLQFEVDLDSDKMRQEAIDHLFEKIPSDKQLTNFVLHFLKSNIEEKRSLRMKELLYELSKEIHNEEGKKWLTMLQGYSLDEFKLQYQYLQSYCHIAEKKIGALSSSALSAIDNTGLTANDFFQGNRGIYGFFLKCSLLHEKKNIEDLNPNSYVVKTIQEDKWVAGKTSKETEQMVMDLSPTLLSILEELTQAIAHYKPEYILNQNFLSNTYSLALLWDVQKTINEHSGHRDNFHISEFAHRIAKIIQNEPIPFIYERIGEKYHHLLIDEFQDTSTLQWHNLLPLMENGLAYNKKSLIVGDGKQSIYRWRGGNVEQFASLPALPEATNNPILESRQQSLIRHYHPLELKYNFRSKKNIIEFNNQFFNAAAEMIHGELKQVYHNNAQISNDKSEYGYVYFEFHDLESDDKTEQEIQFCIQHIKESLKDGYQYSDICILCRNNKTGEYIAEGLLQNGIPIVSKDSLLLKNSGKVAFLVSCLQYSLNKNNVASRIGIATYLSQNKTIDNPLTLLNAENFHESLNLLCPHFKTIESQSYTLFELVDAYIMGFGLNEPTDQYIFQFLNLVGDFIRRYHLGLYDFLDYWEEKKDNISVQTANDQNAVEIMTIHRSKGLEFPIVVMPNIDWQLSKSIGNRFWVEDQREDSILKLGLLNEKKSLAQTSFKDLYLKEQDKKLLDNINLIYVAFTRASERLLVFSKTKSPDSEGLSSWNIIESGLKAFNFSDSSSPIFEFGKKEKKSTGEPKKQTKEIYIDNYFSSDWREKLNIATEYKKAWSDNTSGADYGNKIHQLFSLIIHKNDLDKAISIGLDQGWIKKPELSSITPIIQSILNHPTAGRYFEDIGQVKNEMEISNDQKKLLRPDKVIFQSNKTIVIDYKTGSPQEAHKKQIKEYGKIFQNLYAHPIELALIYLKPVQVVTVAL